MILFLRRIYSIFKINCCAKKGKTIDKALFITKLAKKDNDILTQHQKDFYVLSILKTRDEHLINAMIRNGLDEFEFKDGRSIMEFLCKHKMVYAIDTFLDIRPEKISSALKYVFKYKHHDLMYHFSQKATAIEHEPLMHCASKYSGKKSLRNLMRILKQSNEIEKFNEIKSLILFDYKLKSVH